MEEFQKHCEKVLRRVFTRERGKCRADLRRRAVDGRNKDQQQERLSNWIERPIGTRPDKLRNNLIDRGILVITLAVKMREEFVRGRKCGQDFARCRASSVLFEAF